MDNFLALLIVLILGFCILLGSIIVFISKNNNKLVNYSIALALGVIISLIVVELVPETYEKIIDTNSLLVTISFMVIFGLFGFFILKILDKFIPDHEGDDDKENLLHIGIISSVALILHNIIEGMVVYSACVSDKTLGLLLSIGVGLHNIPLGITITSTIYKSNNNKKKTLLMTTFVACSTFVGGLIMLLLRNYLTDLILGILLSITLGMLVFITCYELIPHLVAEKDKKTTILGILTGIVIVGISMLFHHH